MINLNNVLCEDNRLLTDADVDRLAAMIGNVGLLNPIILQKLDGCNPPRGSFKKGSEPKQAFGWKVLAGRCRYRALMKLQRYELDDGDYRVIDTDDPELISMVENYGRKDLSTMEKARQLALLHERHKPAELASILGETEKHVRVLLSLRNLTGRLQEALEQDKYPKLRIGHYEVLAKYPEKVQLDLLKDKFFFEYHVGTVERLRNTLAARYARLLKTAPFDAAADCAGCPNRSGAEPWLFEEFKDPDEDHCTDPDCFKARSKQAVREKLKAAKKENPKIVPVITGSGEPNIGLGKSLGPVLVRGEYDMVKNDVPPEEANAIVIDGAGAGTYCRITTKKGSAADGAPKPKSLKERRQELEKRRQKRAQEKLIEYLEKNVGGIPVPAPDTLWRLVGHRGVCSVSGTYDGRSLVNWKGKAEKVPVKKIQADLWKNLLGSYRETLRVECAERRIADWRTTQAEAVCYITGLNWKDFLKQGAEEIPEPKSWTADAPLRQD